MRDRFFFLALILLLIFTLNVNAITDNNLVSYYNFNETSGTVLIDSKNDNNGTNSNATVNQAGLIGKAYSFTNASSSKVTIATESDYDFINNASVNSSICVWVKYSTSPNYGTFWSKGTYPAGSWVNTYTTGGERLQNSFFKDGSNSVYQEKYGAFQDNQWRLICSVRSGTTLTFYRDLNAISSNIVAGTPGTVNVTEALTFGWDNQAGHYYTGLLDEASIWARALTLTDINELYNGGAGRSYPFITPIPRAITLSIKDSNTAVNLINSMDCNSGLVSYNNQLSPYTLNFPDTNQWYQCTFTSLGYDSNIVNIYTDSNKTVNYSLYSDLIPPVTNGTTTAANYGFVTDFNIGWSLNCLDEKNKALDYDVNLVLNDTNNFNIYHLNAASNLTKTGTYLIPNYSKAKIIFSCKDIAGNVTTQTSASVYALLFRLVNENTGASINTAADLNALVSGASVYTYDGNYTYDFNATGTTSKKFLSPGQSLKFDFIYKDTATTKISRDIDFTLIPDSNIPICLAPFQTFYEQIFVSSTSKPIVLYNDASNCYNLTGYTKYIYDNALMIKGYTINKPYYIYTYTGTIKILLAMLEGSTPSILNIDAIQLNQQNVNLPVTDDMVSFKCLDNLVTNICDQNILQIYYLNNANDNTSLNFKIYLNNTLLLNVTETTNPNDYLLNYYYGGIPGLSDQNMFYLEVTKVNATKTTTSEYWFNTLGASLNGILDPFLAIILAVLLVIFGLTFVSYKFAFGWFGIISCLIALMILTFAPGFWYIRFFQVIIVIIIIFIGLIFKNEQAGLN